MFYDHILIAIQSDIHREGICSIIRNHYPDCTIQSISKCSEIVDLFSKYPQALCLFSTSLIEVQIGSLLEELDEINRHKRTVLMVPATNSEKIEQALRAGINGLFTQHCSSEELLKILSEVSSDKNSYSRIVSELMMKNYRKKQYQRPESERPITKRESEVLSLIVKGFTSAEIAKKLFISPRTVETHRCNLMRKLKLKNTAALVRFALKEKNIGTS
jgi:DNA-binding NarL/FixJ family response regulator